VRSKQGGGKMGLNRIFVIFLMCALIFLPSGDALSQQLTAGDVDDNLNFDYFIDYMENMRSSEIYGTLPALNLTDRVVLNIVDNNGIGVSNAFVQIISEGTNKVLLENYAGTNGIFYFFPQLDGVKSMKKFILNISSPDDEWRQTGISLDLDKLGKDRTKKIVAKEYDNNLPSKLDLMFVIDTTGSMSDELTYLTAEFEGIVENITDDNPNLSIRYGLVVYRDSGDAYVVKGYNFTNSLYVMKSSLSAQKAAGGGDYPEAMDRALAKAVSYDWRSGNCARMMFLVADAPPHDEKLTSTMNEVQKARQKGIHIYSLAASGVAETAEYIMRSSSVLTNGRYMFLTDDSGIGNSHAEPKIKGYVITYLNDLVIRTIGSEIAGKRIEPFNDEILRRVGNVTNGIIFPGEGGNKTDGNFSGDTTGGSAGSSGSGSGGGTPSAGGVGSDSYEGDAEGYPDGEPDDERDIDYEEGIPDDYTKEKPASIDDTAEDIEVSTDDSSDDSKDVTGAEPQIEESLTDDPVEHASEESSTSSDKEKGDGFSADIETIETYKFDNYPDNLRSVATNAGEQDPAEKDSEGDVRAPRLSVGVEPENPQTETTSSSDSSENSPDAGVWAYLIGVNAFYVIAAVVIVVNLAIRKR